jgi:thioesterase domain-containing protein
MAALIEPGTPLYVFGTPETDAILRAFQEAEAAARQKVAQQQGSANNATIAPESTQGPPAECVPLNFTCWPPPAGTLFFFHDTTGGVGHIKRMGPHLTLPCCAVQLADSVPLTTFRDMVVHYATIVETALPTGPLRLGGYSFGARTAFHVAAHLQRVCGRAAEILVCVEDPPSFDLAYIQAPQQQRALAMAANLFQAGTPARAHLAEALMASTDAFCSRSAAQQQLLPVVRAQPTSARSFLLSALLAGRAGGLGEEVLSATLRLLSAMSQDAFWQGYAQASPKLGSGVGALALPLGRVLLCRSTAAFREQFNAASEHTLAPLGDDYGTSASVCTPVLTVVQLEHPHHEMFGGICAKKIATAINDFIEGAY